MCILFNPKSKYQESKVLHDDIFSKNDNFRIRYYYNMILL